MTNTFSKRGDIISLSLEPTRKCMTLTLMQKSPFVSGQKSPKKLTSVVSHSVQRDILTSRRWSPHTPRSFAIRNNITSQKPQPEAGPGWRHIWWPMSYTNISSLSTDTKFALFLRKNSMANTVSTVARRLVLESRKLQIKGIRCNSDNEKTSHQMALNRWPALKERACWVTKRTVDICHLQSKSN